MNQIRITLLAFIILTGPILFVPNYCFGSTINAIEDEYYRRLESLDLPFPVFYNESVKSKIKEFQSKKSEASQWIAEGQYALASLGPSFDSAQIPAELALLAVANTRLKPNFVATSTGASGIWPLTYSVAKRYRLITHSYLDQRRNIALSTKVMVQYLRDLENIYQDWHFTISAFYAGPINLNMAIRKSGNTLDYNLVHESLIPEHRQCLEHFMALIYIMNFHEVHQIVPGTYKPVKTDTVCSSVGMSFEYIASKLSINKRDLIAINPEFLEAMVPDIPECMCFQLPLQSVALYRELRDSIEIQDTLTPEQIKEGKIDQTGPTGIPRDIQSSAEPMVLYYTIKSGDNLGLLSKLFDCSIRDIQRWNNMRNTMLYAGKKLKIYVPADRKSEYSKINTMSMAQKQALARRK